MGIINWLGSLLRGKQAAPAETEGQIQQFNQAKQEALERVLGPMDDLVWHALIPFCMGGAVDMYSFSQAMPGTVFATQELIETDGTGPKRNRLGTYELVACTRLQRPARQPEAGSAGGLTPTRLADPSSRMANRLCAIMTSAAHYSHQAVFNPGETAEIPGDDGEPSTCLIFDEYNSKGIPFEINGKRHGLLLVIEIHPSELAHARQHTSKTLLAKMKEADVYPYSDLDRPTVV